MAELRKAHLLEVDSFYGQRSASLLRSSGFGEISSTLFWQEKERIDRNSLLIIGDRNFRHQYLLERALQNGNRRIIAEISKDFSASLQVLDQDRVGVILIPKLHIADFDKEFILALQRLSFLGS